MLRLRQKGEICLLTLKIKQDDPKVNLSDEFEIEVSDFEQTKELLLRLGFSVFATDKRISYELGESLVEINIYDDIPPFLEIESPTKEMLIDVIKILNIKKEQFKAWSGKEMLEYYNKA